MIYSYARGHKVYFNTTDETWRYADTDKIYDDSRPCKKCGRMPTEEGYDACLGYIEGAKYACCGHGVQEPYVIYKDEELYLSKDKN